MKARAILVLSMILSITAMLVPIASVKAETLVWQGNVYSTGVPVTGPILTAGGHTVLSQVKCFGIITQATSGQMQCITQRTPLTVGCGETTFQHLAGIHSSKSTGKTQIGALLAMETQGTPTRQPM
jgi:hypothetical protein